MKSIVSFDCPSYPVPSEDIGTTPGKELADEIVSTLRGGSLETESGSPVEGEGGWSVWVKYGGVRYRLFLSLAGIGNPGAERWAIGVAASGLARWFRKRLVAHGQDEIVHLLERFLVDALKCTDVRLWNANGLSDEQEAAAKRRRRV